MSGQPGDEKRAAGTSAGAGSRGSSQHAHVSVEPDPNNPGMVTIRTRKRMRSKRRKKKRRLSRGARIAIIVASVVVGLIAACALALAIAVNVGNVNLHALFPGLQEAPASAETHDDGKTVVYKGHTYRYNEDVVSVLLIGHDDETDYAIRSDASCADAIVLLTVDTSTNRVQAVAVPRNSWVPVDIYYKDGTPAGTRDMQVTLSHAVEGLSTPQECAENTAKAVSRIFYNLPLSRYIDIDQEAVARVTEEVGGVQVEALETIPDTTFSKGDTVLLQGEQAYRYVSYRDTNVVESALDRQERQVQFVKAFVSKVRTLGARKVVGVYGSIADDVTTNLEASDVTYLASCLASGKKGGFSMSQIKGKTKTVKESNGIEYERYYLDDDSVFENTLKAYYTKVD